jgi:hypothetical protein
MLYFFRIDISLSDCGRSRAKNEEIATQAAIAGESPGKRLKTAAFAVMEHSVILLARNDGGFVFDARPYSAQSWLAAWHYAPALCWEDMMHEFEQDVEAALRASNDIDATLADIYRELRKVDMPTDPVFLESTYKYCGRQLQLARQGDPKPCAEAVRYQISDMVSWLIELIRKQPTDA